MRVDGLKEPECDPDVHRDNVEVAPREVAQTQRTTQRAYGKNQGLGWMGVFSSKAERCGVLVVQFVDVTVERTIVQCLMGCEWVIRRQISCRCSVVRTKKVIGVLNNEEKSDLPGDRLPVWEGYMPGLHAKELRHGAEHPNLDSLACECDGNRRYIHQAVQS